MKITGHDPRFASLAVRWANRRPSEKWLRNKKAGPQP
jgi:hypothetical protein